MDYSVYNDYEILYLIHEGNEDALNLLFRKYEHLIFEMAKSMCPYRFGLYDLAQEGFMVLYRCIWSYRDSEDTTFYSYFSICYRRRLQRLLLDSYYDSELPRLEENVPDVYHGRVLDLGILADCLSEEEKEMIDEIIFKNLSYSAYGRAHGLTFAKVKYRYDNLMEKLRECLMKQ